LVESTPDRPLVAFTRSDRGVGALG
jgi:hypothetical protein